MRTIPAIGKLLRKVDEVIPTEFIPAITDENFVTENGRKLLSLAPQLGGLGIPKFEELYEIEFRHNIRTPLQSHY